MKANHYSLINYQLLVALFFISIISGLTSVRAQCPTVTNNLQSLCDVQSVLVGDLEAIDNGGGIVWYDSPTSTTPLSNSESLISGEDYYADDNTGSCGTRARVDVVIYKAPMGDPFQGFCLDDPTLATVGDLVATGNNVQWYLSASGGIPLNDSDILIDDTIYYADQENPDTGCRTSRLSVLVKVGNTPVPTGDMVQQFCTTPEYTPTVGDLIASGTNNWYISLFSALPLPLNTPLVNGQTYYATTLDPPCESTGRLPVLVILDNGPEAGENGTLEICEDNTTTTVDLFTILGGTPDTGGTWSPSLNSGTGVFDPNVDADGEYTYTVSSNNSCPDDSATVTVISAPAPNAGENGTLELCSIDDPVDLFDSLGGTPETGGVWSPTLASGTGIFDPNVDIATSYTYTVAGTVPCPDATATVNVTVAPYKDAGEDGAINLCSNEQSVDLFNSLGGTPETGGVWTPTLNSGTGVFDPNIDAEGVYVYSFPNNSPCPNETASVTVTVSDMPDPGANSTIEICSNDLSTINLFNSLGGNPDTGGIWSPALSSGTDIFDPAIDPAGAYTYSLVGTEPCPDALAVVNIIINEEPNAGTDTTIDICSNDDAIDLFDSLGGSPDSGGTWSPTLTSGTGVFNPNMDAPGTYVYTVTGTFPCSDVSASVTINVTPFLNAGTDSAITLCENDGSVDLFESLGGTPDIGGTWSPALASGTGVFDPNIDAAGSYTYSFSGNGECPNSSATITVSLLTEPDAGLDATLNLCNVSTTQDLFDSLGGTPQPGGTWSPTLASGTGVFDPNTDPEGIYTYTINSACGISSASVTISITDANIAGTDGAVQLCSTDSVIDLFNNLGGSPDTGGVWTPTLTSGTGVFDPNIDSPGVYTYTISNSGTECPDDSATVEVSVLNEPDAGNDGTMNLCNISETINLFDGLTGFPDAGGTWSPALSSGSGVFTPGVDPEGVYTYTVTNACGSSSASVTIAFLDTNDAGLDGTIEICTNDSTTDLFDSLGGTPQSGGTWSPALASGTGIFDPNVDAEGVYTYTVSGTSICPADSATVTVSISESPDAGIDGTINLCTFTETLNLFDGLTGTPDTGGTWSPALSSGTGSFDPTVDPEGVYTYTVVNSCGSSSATVTITISVPNDSGTDGSIVFCSTDTAQDLFDSLGGTPQSGGVWTPTLASGSGLFDPNVDTEGVYTYTVSSDTSFCPESSSTVTVSFAQEPNAGEDNNLNLCSDITDVENLFDSLGGTPDTGGVWSPTLSSGTGVFDPTIDNPGVYTYTVTSVECGTTSSASITVSIIETPDVTGLSMSLENNVICLGLEDAIVNITGATQLDDGEYSIVYQLSGSNVSVNTIPVTVVGGSTSFIIPQILLENPGITFVTINQLFVLDQNCSAFTDNVVPVRLKIELAPTPQLITNGSEFCLEDEPTISDLTNNILDYTSVVWYDQPEDGTPYADSDLLEDGKVYYAAIVTQYNCESITRLEVTVSLISCIRELLIPDGFSPNGDDVNDVFDILNLNELYPNFKLSIYNRYGNILYEGNINSPKWDGTGKGSTLLPVGVYFYILEFNDGEREPLQGRVYLSR